MKLVWPDREGMSFESSRKYFTDDQIPNMGQYPA